MRNLKAFLKSVVFNSGFLRNFFILFYQWRGRKPWSAGYSVYKLTYIRDVIEDRLDMFKKEKLPDSYGAHLDERTVEYPWFFSRLKNDEITILDAGSTLNHSDILKLRTLKNRKIYISTLACEGFQDLESHTPSYVFEDLRNLCYREDFFDAVISISTLEHVGMDNTFLYTCDDQKKENDKDAYLNVIREFKRVLKKGGTLYITLPYGLYRNRGWLQIFDGEMLLKLISEFSPKDISKTFFKYENHQWNYSKEDACQEGYLFDIHQDHPDDNKEGLASAQCVVCLEMIKA